MADVGDDGYITIDRNTILVAEKEGDLSVDVTALVANVTDASSVVEFRACFTRVLAREVDRILGRSVTTWGMPWKGLGIPWTYTVIPVGWWVRY